MTGASRLRVAAPLLRSHLCLLGGRHGALPVWPRPAPSAFAQAEHWRRSFASDSKKAKAPETSGADNVEKASETTGVSSRENVTAELQKAEAASSEPSDEVASSDAKAEAAAPSEAPAEEVTASEPQKTVAYASGWVEFLVASSDATAEAAAPSEAPAEEVAAAPQKAEAASPEPSDEVASSDATAEAAAPSEAPAEDVAASEPQKAEAASPEPSDEVASSDATAEAAAPSEAPAEEVAASEPQKAEAATTSEAPGETDASSQPSAEAGAAAASASQDSGESHPPASQEAGGQEEAEGPGSPGGLIGRHLHKSTDLPPASWRHAGEWVDLELERAGIPSEVCDGLPSNWGKSSDFESEPEPNVMWPHPTLHDHRSRPFVRPRTAPGEESESGDPEADDRRLKENRRRLEALWKLSNSHGISWDELDAAFVAFAKSGKQRHAQWSRAPAADIKKFKQELEALDPKNLLARGVIRAGKEYGHPVPIAGHMKRFCEARARAYLQPFCPKLSEDGKEREDPRRCYPSQLRRLTSRLYRQEKRKFFAPWRPGKLSQKLQQLVAARMLRRETNERVYGFEKRT